MTQYRVQPKPLEKVKDQHLPGVFGDFNAIMDKTISRLAGSKQAGAEARVNFFKFLKNFVDAEKFGAMQDRYLSDETLDPKADLVKYIDPTIWFESKLALAHSIGLDKRGPISILDIGTGPGHFPLVAMFYGHKVLGTDLPARTTNRIEGGHLYDALADIYNVRRIPLTIHQYQPLPPFEERFDLVTAFLAAFNVDGDRQPWTIEAWNFFLADVRDNVLKPDGELLMTLANNKLSDSVWTDLCQHAAFHNDRNKHILFKSLEFAGAAQPNGKPINQAESGVGPSDSSGS